MNIGALEYKQYSKGTVLQKNDGTLVDADPEKNYCTLDYWELKPPPIGVMPENIWIENRAVELADAISRFLKAPSDRQVLLKWSEELHRHLTKMQP